jgi:hypothetical protein
MSTPKQDDFQAYADEWRGAGCRFRGEMRRKREGSQLWPSSDLRRDF